MILNYRHTFLDSLWRRLNGHSQASPEMEDKTTWRLFRYTDKLGGQKAMGQYRNSYFMVLYLH